MHAIVCMSAFSLACCVLTAQRPPAKPVPKSATRSDAAAEKPCRPIDFAKIDRRIRKLPDLLVKLGIAALHESAHGLHQAVLADLPIALAGFPALARGAVGNLLAVLLAGN